VRNQRLILNGLFQAARFRPGCPRTAKSGAWMHWRQRKSFDANAFVQKFHCSRKNLVGIPALRALGLWGNRKRAIAGHGNLSELVDGNRSIRSGRGHDEARRRGQNHHRSGHCNGTGAARFQSAFEHHRSAAHMAAAAGQITGCRSAGLIRRRETRAYVEQVMATAGKNLDAMAAPCWNKIAFALHGRNCRVSRVCPHGAGGKDAFVVLDTAPTGHTLLLLDATEFITGKSRAKRATCRRSARVCYPVCVMLTIPAYWLSHARSPRFTRRAMLQATCAARRLNRSRGLSTRALPGAVA